MLSVVMLSVVVLSVVAPYDLLSIGIAIYNNKGFKSCLGQVFNFKLVSFASKQNK